MDSQDLDNELEQNAPDAPEQGSDDGGDRDAVEQPDFMSEYPDDPNVLREMVVEREIEIESLRIRNEDLQSKLVDRDRVVQALTNRLEQAAEQLDRLHRSGADRGGKLLSGIPSEVIDEQRELIGDLKAAIQHWEDLQSTSAMGRFEQQLNELRDMLAQQLNLKTRIDKPAPVQERPSAAQQPQSLTHKKLGPGGKNSGWEQMKAALLGESSGGADSMVPGAEPMVPGAAPQPEQPTSVSSAVSGSGSNTQFREIKIEIKSRPDAFNIANADHATLQQAVKDRDKHIDYLYEIIEQLKREAGMVDLASLKQQKAELDDKLRKAEVEMSMERAKLAREAVRLRQIEEDLPAQPAAVVKERQATQDAADEKGSRWKRFLGTK